MSSLRRQNSSLQARRGSPARRFGPATQIGSVWAALATLGRRLRDWPEMRAPKQHLGPGRMGALEAGVALMPLCIYLIRWTLSWYP